MKRFNPSDGPDEVTCPQCGEIVAPDEDDECPECGADLSGLGRKQDAEDEESPFPSVFCPTCGEEVEPDEDQRCPDCHGDLSALIELVTVAEIEGEVERVTSKSLTTRDHTLTRRVIHRILHLQRQVAGLRRQVRAMDARAVKADALKVELQAAVQKVLDGSRVQRPQDPLVAATAELRGIAASRKKGTLQ
jgi:ssDNA-binding Zn-finger/Zn-ribbon topoisomerase 1